MPTLVGPRCGLTRADVGLAAGKDRGGAARGSLTSCLPSAALSRTGRPMHAPADFMLLSDSCARPARSILGTLSSPASPRRSHRSAPHSSTPLTSLPAPHAAAPPRRGSAPSPRFSFFFIFSIFKHQPACPRPPRRGCPHGGSSGRQPPAPPLPASTAPATPSTSGPARGAPPPPSPSPPPGASRPLLLRREAAAMPPGAQPFRSQRPAPPRGRPLPAAPWRGRARGCCGLCAGLGAGAGGRRRAAGQGCGGGPISTGG